MTQTTTIIAIALCALASLCACDTGSEPAASSAAPDAAASLDAAFDTFSEEDGGDAPDHTPDAPDAPDEDDAPEDLRGPSVADELGLTLYSGAIDPIEESSVEGVTTYTFDPEQGPVCLRGDPFRMSVRDNPDSRDLVIFLQGGGACWSGFCLAVTRAPPGMPAINILDPTLEANPVKDWDAVYLPYCDGSFFAGDAEIDDDLNGKGLRRHRGLANLTAALEVAAARFPDPDRVLLAGSSGGAYGTLLGTPLTRHYFPDAKLFVMADSGVGLGRDGDPEYVSTILDEFQLTRFIPADCPECTAEGHMTGVIGWYLERDPDVIVGTYSSTADSVLADIFLDVTPERFEAGLVRATGALEQAYPERFRRFVTRDAQHTSLLGDATGIIGTDFSAVELPPGALETLLDGGLQIGSMEGTTVGELDMATWLGAMLEEDREVWIDAVE